MSEKTFHFLFLVTSDVACPLEADALGVRTLLLNGRSVPLNAAVIINDEEMAACFSQEACKTEKKNLLLYP